MISPNNTLTVLDNVHIDMTLPKYKTKKEGDKNYLSGVGTPDGENIPSEMSDNQFAAQFGTNRAASSFSSFVSFGNSFVVSNMNGSNEVDNSNKKRGLWTWIKQRFNSKASSVTPIAPTVSVEEVFTMILRNQQELDFVVDKIKVYDTAVEKAKSAGQIALTEQLLQARKIYAYETQLFAVDRKKFIDEERVVKFVKDCEKGLRLTWLKNYTRAIPDVVLEQKMIVDQYRVFDAYVVMHYDPDAKSIKQMEAEKAAELKKKKDPILFGIIQGSRKLYFVGDWKDELCDLTFDVFVEKYGESSVLLKGE